MGLLPATLGICSNGTRWRLLRHLLPLCPAPAAWRLSRLAPRLTKIDEEPGCVGEGCYGPAGVVGIGKGRKGRECEFELVGSVIRGQKSFQGVLIGLIAWLFRYMITASLLRYFRLILHES